MAMTPAFFDAVRASLFGGTLAQPQVEGIEIVVSTWERAGDGDDRKLAYLLGTAFHETARTMQPIHEYGKRSYFDKYEPGTKIGAALGNTLKGDGYRFRGRGFVQLTGRANYRKAGEKMNADLLANPEQALEPAVAAMALIRGSLEGWYTGKKLGTYINAEKADFTNARRVINGTDRAADIAGYADKFLVAIGKGKEAPKPTPAPTAPATPLPPAGAQRPAQQPGSAAAIIIAIGAVVAAAAAGWDWLVNLFS